MSQNTLTLTKDENFIVSALANGIAIRFTGNGFNHASVKEDGTFQSRKNSGDGWYTQQAASRMPQEAVESLIAKGIVRVNVEPVGGVLVQENTLALV